MRCKCVCLSVSVSVNTRILILSLSVCLITCLCRFTATAVASIHGQESMRVCTRTHTHMAQRNAPRCCVQESDTDKPLAVTDAHPQGSEQRCVSASCGCGAITSHPEQCLLECTQPSRGRLPAQCSAGKGWGGETWCIAASCVAVLGEGGGFQCAVPPAAALSVHRIAPGVCQNTSVKNVYLSVCLSARTSSAASSRPLPPTAPHCAGPLPAAATAAPSQTAFC